MASASRAGPAWKSWQSHAAVNPAIYILGAIPGVWTFYLGLMDQLGADPLKVLERSLGLWSLRFLVIGLAITPLRRLGGPNLVRHRRAVGLLAFFYALAHVATYVALDQQFDLSAIIKDILKRPYIMVGLLAFSILIPLAVTSSNRMIKRLGAQSWQKLHRWVYLAAAAAAVHFIMLVKAWPPEPLIYAALVASLLLFRVVDRKRRAPRSQQRQGESAAARP